MAGDHPQPMMIDADAHVTEPRRLWEEDAPAGRTKDVPHYETEDERIAMFIGEDRVSAWRNVSQVEYVEAEAPTHVNDVGKRLEWMDENGFWGQVCYPNVAGSVLGRLMSIRDDQILDFCVRRYNDWLADWASSSSGRLIGVAMLPLQDMDASLKELERAIALGHKSVILPHRPEEMGLPLLTNEAWNPLWAACQEAGIPVSFHGGFGDDLNRKRLYNPDWRDLGYSGAAALGSIVAFIDNVEVLLLLTFSGILARYPGLKIASAESGIGYIPYLLEAADWHFHATNMRDERPEFELLPSEYFKRQVYVTYWFERAAPAKLLEFIGPDRVMFETDFPHRTSIYGQANTTGRPIGELIAESTDCVAPEHRSKVLWENAAELYGVSVPALH